MPSVAHNARKSLWDRWWVRFPAYMIGTPLIVTAANLTVIIAIVFLSSGRFADLSGVHSWRSMLVVIGIEMVPLLVPLIAVELGNRRRGQAVPPALCALFVAIFAAAGLGMVWGVAQVMVRMERYLPGSDWEVGVVLIGGCAVAAGALSTALVSPLIRRWTARHASARDLAEHF